MTIAMQDGPYDPNPHHPWNELHQALFTWHPLASDQAEEHEGDPLFWPLPKEAWDKWTVSKELAGCIDRFNEKLIQDPLKRAMLQHDVWMFLDGLEGLPMGNTRTYPMGEETERNALRQKLVPILRQLALTSEEIRSLPDNYSQAVKAKVYPPFPDPKDAEQPFLPPDLWEQESSWVLVGREDEALLAEEHVKLVRGRSAFFILLALPEGRKATLDYLTTLRSLHQISSPPKPPVGTRVILLRRAFLLDPKGVPQLSPLTEEIRMRVSIEATDPGAAGLFEFHLVRSQLFSGRTVGLRTSKSEDRAAFPVFHRLATARGTIRNSCKQCHSSGAELTNGILLSGFDRSTGEKRWDGVALKATTIDRESALTLGRQRKDESWELISRFWPRD